MEASRTLRDSEGKHRVLVGEPGTSRDPLDNETRQLIQGYLHDFTGLATLTQNESKALSTMKRVVAGILEKYRFAYDGGY